MIDYSINPTDLIALIKNPLTLVTLAWLGKEIWANSKHKSLVLDSTLKDLSDKINLLTNGIVRLEAKLENLEKYSEMLPKLRADVDASHVKIRELSGSS